MYDYLINIINTSECVVVFGDVDIALAGHLCMQSLVKIAVWG